MLSAIICFASALLCFLAARRSITAGLAVILVVGYAYGIVRANIEQPGSHFIFDAAVAGLYLGRLTGLRGPQRPTPRSLVLWCAALAAWPLLLMARPVQDPLVQLVGFRAAAFLLPFCIIGSQLTDQDRYTLACWCAALNVVAFAFAIAEFTIGLRSFYPENATTFLIYQSNDVGGERNYRIPAVFANAHLYGGTMVLTFPLLLGAWMSERKPASHRLLILTAMVGASFGVFMSATRMHAVVLFVFVGFATLATRMTLLGRAAWLTMIAVVAAVVLSQERLMRFESITDTAYVTERIGASVNSIFLDAALQYPMGNGLGGGGTSLPAFLQPRLTNGLFYENEYARLMLEMGIPGLILWVCFLVWVMSRNAIEPTREWRTARLLAWIVVATSLASAMLGTGMLTSIPTTALFLIYLGWLTQGTATGADNREPDSVLA